MIQRRNAALAASVLQLSGKQVLVGSSKTGIRLKYLLRNPELDIRVVRLVRDGRGVALTYTDTANFADARDPRLRNGGTGVTERRPALPLRRAAKEWPRSNEEGTAILRQLAPDRWIEVRYEDLCTSPENTLRRIFDFIGTDSSLVALDFKDVEHHVVGNGMRLDSTSTIKLDERWRSVLTMSDLTVFDDVAGALSRDLGYQ